MKKPELLAPAGNLEKCKMALFYGADAVYLGGKKYGLRAYADNFTEEEMKEAVSFAHSMGKKIFVTMNIFAHNVDLKEIEKDILAYEALGIDAVIVSDLGIFSLVRKTAPNLAIHVSTQANTVNYASASMWYELGAKRVILGRELSLPEIKEIREKTPKGLELEVFVHGAMCMSYSGRCLLSNYMTGRDANGGECAQPCRWKYHIVEDMRMNEPITVEETDRGTFFMNSKDLCMIEHIPELMELGIDSFKIEGRMKSFYYSSIVVNTYRQAMDAYFSDPKNYKEDPRWLSELKTVSHRQYSTGFFFDRAKDGQIYESAAYIKTHEFAGLVLEYDAEKKLAKIEQRNKIALGEEIEVVGKGDFLVKMKVEGLYDEKGQEISSTPHPQMIYYLKSEAPLPKNGFLRKKISEAEG